MFLLHMKNRSLIIFIAVCLSLFPLPTLFCTFDSEGPHVLPWPGGCGVFYLEKRGILVPVVVLLPGVFPRYPEDALLVVLPHQPGVFAAVHLLDEPLAQLAVAAAAGASVIQL